MNILHAVSSLRNLRDDPLWSLLAADKAPVVAGLLQCLLLDEDKVLASSVLHERAERALELLRSAGEEMPQTAQAYISDWLARGWLSRRLPTGAHEEEYELTSEAAGAVRYLLSVIQPRRAATESRLATVISQLSRLAEETDANPHTRMQALLAERERIDREIDLLAGGAVKTLPADRALERAREIILLADELTGDFHQVRDEFEVLNKSLRESLLDHEGSRGEGWRLCFLGWTSSARAMQAKPSTPFGACCTTASSPLYLLMPWQP